MCVHTCVCVYTNVVYTTCAYYMYVHSLYIHTHTCIHVHVHDCTHVHGVMGNCELCLLMWTLKHKHRYTQQLHTCILYSIYMHMCSHMYHINLYMCMNDLFYYYRAYLLPLSSYSCTTLSQPDPSWTRYSVCVCVCVCDRERERQRKCVCVCV